MTHYSIFVLSSCMNKLSLFKLKSTIKTNFDDQMKYNFKSYLINQNVWSLIWTKLVMCIKKDKRKSNNLISFLKLRQRFNNSKILPHFLLIIIK